ncbi:MAG: DUF1428 domain-containing protein [Pseudomonadota bacterium]
MSYVECYVAAVPNENQAEYKKHASAMATVFKDHGATRVVDCWGADVPPGETTSFPIAVKAEANETVALGWVEWASKSDRDEGMANAMKDERMAMGHMPFDGKRLIFAGFEKFSES